MARHRFTIEVETNEAYIRQGRVPTWPDDPADWDLEDISAALFLRGPKSSPVRRAEIVEYSPAEATPA